MIRNVVQPVDTPSTPPSGRITKGNIRKDNKIARHRDVLKTLREDEGILALRKGDTPPTKGQTSIKEMSYQRTYGPAILVEQSEARIPVAK